MDEDETVEHGDGTGASASGDGDSSQPPGDGGESGDSSRPHEDSAGASDSSSPHEDSDSDSSSPHNDPSTAEGNTETDSDQPQPGVPDPEAIAAEDEDEVPADVQKYARFTKVDGAQYDRVNDFLRERTHITAREWAIARLCSDFRTETGVEMTKIGENLPELVPFMTDTYTPQAVNQARSSFEGKIRKAGATFLYGAMCDFFTAEELDDVMYEATEVAKFLLEVEGVDLSVEDELEAEERISTVMREVRDASKELRTDE